MRVKMKEITGNLWDYVNDGYIVITTNGALNSRGECVMGRGTALQAKNRYPGLARRIGQMIEKYGNHVHLFQMDTDQGEMLITFPVKHHWSERANHELIARSADELRVLANKTHATKIFLPRPGCGNGCLKWDNVKPLLKCLDDRFTIVERHP